MSKNLNGVVSAHLNISTNQQNEPVITEALANESPLAFAVRELHSGKPCDLLAVSEAIHATQCQCLDVVKVIAQCTLRDSESSMDQHFYATPKVVANALDMMTQVMQLANSLHFETIARGYKEREED